MALTQADFEELFRLEIGLWQPETRQSPVWMDAVLSDGFVEIGASGQVYSRLDTLAPTVGPLDVELPFRDYAARLVTSDVVLVTYTRVQHLPDGSDRRARRASLWFRSGSGWKLAFHQGTLVES